jgi:Phage integrase, N-terminal SAM-like domain
LWDSPDRLGIEDVRAYQLHLIAKKRSWSHINQAACALRFFFGVTMGQQETFERIVNGREPEKLPPVLAPDEIARFLEAVVGLRNRVALTTAYAAGFRIGEVSRRRAQRVPFSVTESFRLMIPRRHCFRASNTPEPESTCDHITPRSGILGSNAGTSAGDGRTIELRIRISRRGGGSARCSGSRARVQPTNFFPRTPPSTTLSTSNAISPQPKRTACFALRR